MNTQLFDYLLHQFEQSYSLENYIAWKKGQTVDVSEDYLYSEKVRVKNQLVQNSFIASGDEGMKYLIGILNKGNEDERERAVTIIGEIGHKFNTRFNLQGILAKRLPEEPEIGVCKRINYSLDNLAL
jgi:hypothetical protein